MKPIFKKQLTASLRVAKKQNLPEAKGPDSYNSEYLADVGNTMFLNKKFPKRRHELVEQDGQLFILTSKK